LIRRSPFPRFALVALGIGAAPAILSFAAGQQLPAPPLVTSSESTSSAPEPVARIVKIDAVVTDRRGKPILNLTPLEFEVVENGVVQRLNAVELHTSSSPGAALSPIESAEDEQRAARQPGTRVFAFLLDEFHVTQGPTSDLVRDSFLRFIDEQVRAPDLIAVLKPLDSVTEIRFTRDRDAAREAIRAFSGRKGDYEARTEFEKKYIGRAPGAVQAARAQIVLSGLRALTSRLGELGAGRSAIVLVSEGFTRSGGGNSERRVPDVQGLVRAASRSNVAMYTFDPAGPDAMSSAADADRSATFLQTIAEQTGGEAVMNAADLSAGLERVSRDLDGYYLLSYTSSHAGEGRFYDVQVRAKRAGAQVRTRTGYWAPVRSALLSAADRRPSAPARIVRKSALIDTWLGLTVAPDGPQHVTFTWVPAELKGRRSPVLPRPSVVALKVTTTEGAVLFEGEISAAREGLRAAAVREDAAFFEAQAGRIQLDLTIFAADGSQIDQAAHDVDVPDVNRADPLILPPQVFSSSSAMEFRQISDNVAAAPIPAREFRRTERLLVRVPTHSSSGAAVAIAARVMNRSGQVLREIQPMPSRSDGISQFDLPLSWLAPGEYSIELNATNTAGAAKEIIRIRVTG
jgi:VWFA-related protein